MPINQMAAAYLAYFAYIDDAQPVVNPKDFVACLSAVPQGPANGPWTLTWGPAINNGLLAYVATGKDGTYALAIRGTDTDDSIPAFSDNVLADLEANAVPWVYQRTPDPTMQLSAGTNGALALAMCMSDPTTDVLLLDYLRSVANSGVTDLIVTGHSLGGAMTMAVTAFLSDQLPQARSGTLKLWPHSFAAPTVWSTSFATWFMKTFTYYAAVNSNDIVPMAWNNLNGIIALYPNPYPGAPLEVVAAIALIEPQVPPYASITPTDEFAGNLVSTTDWYTEAESMHSMAGQYFPHATGVPAPPIPGATTRVAAKPRLAAPR